MKKLQKEIDFLYPSELSKVKKWKKHHSRNACHKALSRARKRGIKNIENLEIIDIRRGLEPDNSDLREEFEIWYKKEKAINDDLNFIHSKLYFFEAWEKASSINKEKIKKLEDLIKTQKSYIEKLRNHLDTFMNFVIKNNLEKL